jgi:hypothetical protein
MGIDGRKRQCGCKKEIENDGRKGKKGKGKSRKRKGREGRESTMSWHLDGFCCKK